MEKGKKLCPHCGKENNEDARFCGYCGMSMLSTDVSSETSEDNHGASTEEKVQVAELIREVPPRKLNLKINPIRFSLFLIVLLAFFTLPSEVRHKDEIKAALVDIAKEKMRNETSVSILNDALIKAMVENSISSIKIKNYYLFAIGEVSFKQDKYVYPAKASIALFGKVFILLDKDDLIYYSIEDKSANNVETTDEYPDTVYVEDDYIGDDYEE